MNNNVTLWNIVLITHDSLHMNDVQKSIFIIIVKYAKLFKKIYSLIKIASVVGKNYIQ